MTTNHTALIAACEYVASVEEGDEDAQFGSDCQRIIDSAATIAQALEAHDELVAALRECVRRLDATDETDPDGDRAAPAIARAALAKAQS